MFILLSLEVHASFLCYIIPNYLVLSVIMESGGSYKFDRLITRLLLLPMVKSHEVSRFFFLSFPALGIDYIFFLQCCNLESLDSALFPSPQESYFHSTLRRTGFFRLKLSSDNT